MPQRHLATFTSVSASHGSYDRQLVLVVVLHGSGAWPHARLSLLPMRVECLEGLLTYQQDYT